MSKRGGKSTLGDAKGGGILGDMARRLRSALAPPERAVPPAPSGPPGLGPEDAALLKAFERRLPPPPPPRASMPAQASAVCRPAASTAPAPASRAGGGEETAELYPRSDMGAAAFRTIAAMRDRLDGLIASHDAPVSVTPEARSLVLRRVTLGSRKIASIINADDGHFLGYDFGTSTTKAVLRHPHNPSAPAFAAPVPPGLTGGGQPHLWPTAIWYDPLTERFSPVPAPGWTCLHGFKSALIERRERRTCCGTPVEMIEAAAAFLAMHVAYVIGTAAEREDGLRIAGVNMGVPVAALAHARTRCSFDKAARMGLALIPEATHLTRSHLHRALDADLRPALRCTLHAELSGAIAGYCAAPRHFLGAHMIIDCGSATLDMASFFLNNSRWPLNIYDAQVQPLGADACMTYMREGATEEQCRNAARYQEFDVFRNSRGGGFGMEEGKFPYQVILLGGGVDGGVHAPLLASMERVFRRPFQRPGLSSDLQHEPGAPAGRLILADGLARDPIDLREVAMPGDRGPPHSKPGSGLPHGDGFIGPEQT